MTSITRNTAVNKAHFDLVSPILQDMLTVQNLYSAVEIKKSFKLDKSPSSVYAWVVWGLAAIFYFYDNLLQISPSAMKPELFNVFIHTAEQFGSLSAYCLFAYGIMQIPAGILVDRFGPRRMVTAASIFCGLGSLWFGFSTALWTAKIGRFLIGIGASFAFVVCLKLVGSWFAQKKRAFLTGLTAMIGFMGSVLGLSSVSQVVATLGWRQSMQWGGWLGLILGLGLWWIIRDMPEISAVKEVSLRNDPFQESKVPDIQGNAAILLGLLEIIKNKTTWIIAVYAGLMFVPTLAFGGLWGVPFFVEAHGFDRNIAGACVSLIFLGWVFGSPFWGYLSDYLGKRNILMIFSNVVTLIICVAVIYLQHLPLHSLNILLFGLGFFSSGFLLAFTVVQENNPKYLAGTAIGFTNALNTFFGAIAQPLIGKLLDMNTTPELIERAERIFTLTEYQHAFITLPICLIISLGLILLLKNE